MSNNKDKKQNKKAVEDLKKQFKQDWAARRAKELGVSRNLIIGVIAGA